jgi:hypothetical protein
VGQSFTTDDIDSNEHSHPGLSLTFSKEHGSSGGGSVSAAGASPHATSSSAAADGTPRAGRGSGERGERSLAASSVPLTGAYGGGGLASSTIGSAASETEQLGKVRDKYMVFCLDSSDTLERLSKLFARKGKMLTGLAAAGHSVGLAVCSVFSLQDTADILSAKGISLSDLDFAVTSCGAEVWYCGEAATASSTSSSKFSSAAAASDSCVLDDSYDTKLDLNWDIISVRRVLNQCMGQLLRQAGGAAAAASTTVTNARAAAVAASGLSRRTSLSLALPRCRINVDAGGAGHHLMVTLAASDSLAPAGVGEDAAAAPPAAPATDNKQPLTAQDLALLISRIKRRLRRSGLRAQVIAQQDVGATKLHILPLRGSRALALRHLTYTHRVDMSSLVLVAAAKALAPGAGGAPAGVGRFACSDAEDLVAGVQGVLVVPPAAAAGGGSSADGFPVDLQLFTHDGRVQLLPGI